MPSPAPFSSPQPTVALPALYLYPLNDSFIPKHISLVPSGQRVKIGRQTNAKTSPGERNGYFDSKVLSRQHAEIWEENGKIFIKDVKSSNGTFINGERLSLEGLESDPYDLKSDDIVEFGIDIVGEDNKTIIHHKVAARVACIFTEQQAGMAARAEQQQNQGQYSQSPILSQGGPPGSAFNFAPGGPQAQRRPQMPQGLNGMGGMGGSMRPPGKSGLTFDHILSRLQGELNKSRETGQDLQTLSGAMNEIQDTIGGSLPPNLPPYPHVLPPVRPLPNEQSSAVPAPPSLNHAQENAASGGIALADLQSQLLTTQSSLATHGVFAEQEALKDEVQTLRELVGVLRQDSTSQDGTREPKGGFDLEDEEGDVDDDDSDARSISTVVPHALERVDEEDEEEEEFEDNRGIDDHTQHYSEYDRNDQNHVRSSSPEHDRDIFHEHDENRAQRQAELGRPRTPEPNSMGMSRNLSRSTPRSPLVPSSESPAPSLPPSASINELTARLTQLSTQLESALTMSSTLQAQHAAAQGTIVALEDKVKRLEGLVSSIVASKEAAADKSGKADAVPVAESVTAALLAFKNTLQGQWMTVQEEWATERERLQRTRDDWEREMRGAVDERVAAKLSGQAHSAFAPATSVFYAHGNGGLATPPSPRSLSADSGSSGSGGGSGRRRRRRSTSRGRSGSPRRNSNGSVEAPESPVSDDARTELAPNGKGRGALETSRLGIAPDTDTDTGEKSLRRAMIASADGEYPMVSAHIADTSGVGTNSKANSNVTAMHIQTAIGVLVLSVAAAAVIWRVKPE
ncbi:hypothetical protein GGX14DRAFT_455387 [Mycena pura]|uniref:FHA domain-containing protein n=1 Tax=Mycena pura TaxID=153505 RepID=A0AAD6VCB0_9AGAR|nr:hypothetical protein GGX14DRAFT_455387 [Mycena pura]